MRIKQLLIAVGIGTMLAACSSDDSSQLAVPDNSIRMKATITSPATRATGSDYELQNSGNFYDDADDTYINAYITETGTETAVEGQNEYGYLSYKPDSDGWFIPNDRSEGPYPKYPEGKAIDVYGIHPSSVTKSTSQFSVQIDQRTAENYRKSDLMCANTTNHKSSYGTVFLPFKHCLSKIIVKIEGDEEVLPTIKNIQVYAKKTIGITHNQQTGITLGSTIGNTGNIFIGDYDANGQSAIVVPQTITSSYSFISFESERNGNTVYYYYNVDSTGFELKAGHEHTITLSINNSDVKIIANNISPWTKEEGDDKDDTVSASW